MAEIDGDALSSESALFAAVGRQLRFPDYFGHNWDALHDMLRDLEWLDNDRVVLLIDRVDRHGFTESLALLIEVWLSAAQERARSGQALHLVGFARGARPI